MTYFGRKKRELSLARGSWNAVPGCLTDGIPNAGNISAFALQDCRGSVQLCGCHVVFSSERELFRGLRWKTCTGSFKSGGRERLFFP